MYNKKKLQFELLGSFSVIVLYMLSVNIQVYSTCSITRTKVNMKSSSGGCEPLIGQVILITRSKIKKGKGSSEAQMNCGIDGGMKDYPQSIQSPAECVIGGKEKAQPLTCCQSFWIHSVSFHSHHLVLWWFLYRGHMNIKLHLIFHISYAPFISVCRF